MLNQTFKSFELIVVIDGPDPATVEALKKENDPRIKVIELPNIIGGAEARNAGAAKARGEWIAFLDDDDEWLDEKLELQLKAARASDFAYPVILCKLIARTPRADYIWPRRLINQSEHISEYLFSRNSLFQGEGLIQTSMILTKTELLRLVPFEKKLRRHQEWDWLLRINSKAGVNLTFVNKPLVVWYREEERNSISNTNEWQYSFGYIKRKKHLSTPRAYASFLLILVSSLASRERNWSAFFPILKEALIQGKPKFIDLLLFAGIWLIPQKSRQMIRSMIFRGKLKK